MVANRLFQNVARAGFEWISLRMVDLSRTVKWEDECQLRYRGVCNNVIGMRRLFVRNFRVDYAAMHLTEEAFKSLCRSYFAL